MPALVRFTAALLGAAALAAVAAASAAAVPSGPALISKDQHVSVPVLAVTDVGDLTKLALLGQDFAGLLGR
ncbi:hypothetical protein [Kitasatospora sp. HPMI-4]|uniref:hypothetical protein n=1 Tax=Kitasatospora sp. HPMI-4 TaxID=3448443 RepID=UPI003F1C9F60